MVQFNYPFKKFLLYALVINKGVRRDFCKMIDSYLPSVIFNYEDIYDVTFAALNQMVVPRKVLLFNYNIYELQKFLKDNELTELHASFYCDEFVDFVFDSDLRRKVDGMRLNPVFREIDIYREFQEMNQIILKIYLNCFADFSNIEKKDIYVNKYIFDVDEKNLFNQVIKNTSKNFLKTILGLSVDDLSPKEEIKHCLNIIKLKLNTAILEDDLNAIERLTKLKVSISEKLIKIDAGSKSDLEDLKTLLKTEQQYENPKVFTKEELDAFPLIEKLDKKS